MDQLAKNPISLCHHMTLDQRRIAERVRQTQDRRYSSEKLRCSHCNTLVHMVHCRDFYDSTNPPRGLGVIIICMSRPLATGETFSALDPEWIAQSEP